MGNVYATTTVIGIRRQLDTDKDSVSFARLLKEIQENSEVLSRDRYVALHEGSVIPVQIASSHFDRFAGAGYPYVNSARVDLDLCILKQKAAGIRKFANKRIAHFDRSDFANLPTYAELDDCLDYLEDLLKKYLALFRAEMHSIIPVWQFDWKAIFRVPWIV